MTELAIQTSNLTKQFGDLTAVDALSLEVPKRSVFGFLGPNGSGKTTTVRMLLGLLKPDVGSGNVLGHDIENQSHEIRVVSGALLEHNGLYERLSAYKNLAYYADIYHIEKQEKEKRIKDLLESVGLWDRRFQEVADWSRGMRQKLAIARALIHQPRILFLDEPTSGLDPIASIALREELKELVEKEGITVFLNTHNLTEAEKLCDQVAVIHKGKLLQVGSPTELAEKSHTGKLTITGNNFSADLIHSIAKLPEVDDVKYGDGKLHIRLTSANEQAHQIITMLVESGAQIEEVIREKSSLENVFVELVENGENTNE